MSGQIKFTAVFTKVVSINVLDYNFHNGNYGQIL